eukprot:s1408_g5.t1
MPRVSKRSRCIAAAVTVWSQPSPWHLRGQFVGLKCSLCTWHVSQREKTKHEGMGRPADACRSTVLHEVSSSILVGMTESDAKLATAACQDHTNSLRHRIDRSLVLSMAFVQPCRSDASLPRYWRHESSTVAGFHGHRSPGIEKASWRANLAGVAVGAAALHSQSRPASRGARNPLRKLRVELRAKLDRRQASNTIEDSADSAHEQCCRYSRPTSSEAGIEELLRGGQAEEACALVEEMALNMVTPSTSSYGSVIHACSKEGHVDKAALLLAKLRAMECSPDVVSYGSVINGFAKAGRPADIGRLMEDMDEDGVPVDVVMHNGMIEALLKTGRIDDAFDWLVSMMAPEDDSSGSRSREARPNIWSYTKVAGALARQGRTSAVASLLKTMDQMNVKPAIRLHDRILRGLLFAKKRAEAYRWLRQVVRSGLDFDAQFVTLALDVCIQTGSFTEAFAWLNGMEDAGIDPPTEGRGAVSFFVKAVTVCTMAKHLQEGLDWLERAEAANLKFTPDEDGRSSTGPRGIPLRPAYVALMQAFARAQNTEQAKDLLVRLEAEEGRVDTMARTTLVEEFASHDSPEEARQLTQQLEEDGNLTVHVFGRAISACAKASKTDEAIQWFDNMVSATVEPDSVAWNGIINACARVGRVTEAEMWLGEMEASGITPDVFSYTTVINACAQSGRPQEEVCDLAKKRQWKQALQLLHQASSCAAQADLVCFNATISACGKSKLWETSLYVLADIDRECLQKDLFSYNTSFSAVAVAEQWRWSLHLLHDVKVRHLRRDIISFNTAIDGCQGKWGLSLAVLAKMSHQNLEPDVIAHDTAISSSEKGNYWDRALDLLRTLEAGDIQADAMLVFKDGVCRWLFEH